jgi:restriction system protein
MSNSQNDHHLITKYQQYTTRGQIRYVGELEHRALKTHKFLVDSAEWMLERKIKDQFDKWDDIWAKNWQKSQIQLEKELSLNAAEEKTKECQEKIQEIDFILKESVGIDHSVKWNSLIDKKQFKVPNPKEDLSQQLGKISAPVKTELKSLPKQPDKLFFMPQLNIIDRLIKSRTQEKQRMAEALYDQAIFVWNTKVKEVEKYNENVEKRYNDDVKEYENNKQNVIEEYVELQKAWELQMDEYYSKQNETNLKIHALKDLYDAKDPIAIVEYCELVVNRSEYPENFPREVDLEYNAENKFLIIDYVLPSPDDLPKLMEVKYIAVKKEVKEYYLPDTQIVKMYDNAIYNIVLKTIYELFQSDKTDTIETIILNGWVKAINKATGKMTNSCIVSIQVKKAEFMDIDLVNVDPKICFKNLKGVGSSKLFGITPIQPIIKLNKNDKRFVSSYDVAQSLDEGYNLAAMGWEDFEHLIREIFGKEFSYNGGEVKVTQASRDGGVDAIAFDPDPIRGGKIVIQAKRYTNTVGVSAVRDLYGTVLNEGASTGILVTTSDYGPDAYEFAKNKPLKLLSGGNLLYLLEKHGHKAKIDLVEAKRLNKE